MARYIFSLFLWAMTCGGTLFSQTPYYGPNSPMTGQSVQVQLMVYDQPKLGGMKIESVTFNGRRIGLQPPDLYGFRGGGGFQLRPGTYQLEWRVSKDKTAWPRSASYKKSIEISPNDSWVQITVEGDEAKVL